MPLNLFYVTNILYTAKGGMSISDVICNDEKLRPWISRGKHIAYGYICEIPFDRFNISHKQV